MRKTNYLISLCLIALAGLACDLGNPTFGGTPVAALTTATPGGYVSVWLLTPTLTLQVMPPQFSTPIAPVATQTAAAATAVAQTATAAFPTSTPAGVFVAPALCPSPGTPVLPSQAPPFNRYPEVIARYLTGGGATTVLEASLRQWGAINQNGGLVRADRDFTGDGVPEVMIVLLDSSYSDRNPPPGDLLIFGCDNSSYRLLHQSGSDPARGAPELQSADDINGDYLNDLVYVIRSCGDHGCVGAIHALEWSLTLGTFGSLLDQDIVAQEPRIKIQDAENDGVREISITSGVIPFPDAGPQREVTRLYKWDGLAYGLAQTTTSPTQYRIHVIHDADDFLRSGDYKNAIKFYQQAYADANLLGWIYPDDAAHLGAYARFRSILAYILDNRVNKAQDSYNELLNLYVPVQPTPDLLGTVGPPVPPSSLPGYEFANMATIFWENFTINRDLGRACVLVNAYASTHSASLAPLNSFGYANKTYSPTDICPFTQ